MKKLILPLFLVVGLLVGCGESDLDQGADSVSSEPVDIQESDDVGGDMGAPTEAEEPEAPEEFVEVFKGTAQQTGNSKKFEIKHGNEVKISWNGKGDDWGLFSVMMQTEDGKQTDVIVMGEMGETKGSQTFYNIQPGKYYLQWNTANFKPTVTVEEK